jgi:hypothetical protein
MAAVSAMLGLSNELILFGRIVTRFCLFPEEVQSFTYSQYCVSTRLRMNRSSSSQVFIKLVCGRPLLRYSAGAALRSAALRGTGM